MMMLSFNANKLEKNDKNINQLKKKKIKIDSNH